MQVVYTDIDSLLVHVEIEDIYKHMGWHADLYDTSAYSKDHPLQSMVNKKVLGKMKGAGVPSSEFVGLRSKMYKI